MYQTTTPVSPTPSVSSIEKFFEDKKKKKTHRWYKPEEKSTWVMKCWGHNYDCYALIQTCTVNGFKFNIYRLTLFIKGCEVRIDFGAKAEAEIYADWVASALKFRHLIFDPKTVTFRVTPGRGTYV